jgi:sterol desaturase/sphingolipid hydroxylase (fatty acid hydroxylase superfamily)
LSPGVQTPQIDSGRDTTRLHRTETARLCEDAYTETMGMRLCLFGGLFTAAAGTGLLALHGRIAGFAALLAVGLLAWTIVEYLMHRLAFHGFAPHSQHHAQPADRAYILAPLWLSTSAALALFGVFWLVTRSWTAGASIISGVIAGYIAYEVIHLRIHSAERGGALLRALRKHHFYHHFSSDRVCFGVTSPLWDLVFGSVPGNRRNAAGNGQKTCYLSR